MEFISSYERTFFLVVTVFFGLLFSILSKNKKNINQIDNNKRNYPMDAFRFFLASAVMISHSIYIFNNITIGEWISYLKNIPALAWYGVSIFFSITGFLFWDIIRKDDNPNWIKLYVGRFFRIVPLMFINTSLIVFSLAIYMYFKTSSIEISSDIIYWYDFLNNNKPDILNTTSTKKLTGGVYWTLVYEWGFYFSLPILWLLGKKNTFPFTISLCFLLVYVSPNVNFGNGVYTYSLFHFVLGMLACEVSKKFIISENKVNYIFLIALVIITVFGRRLSPYYTSGYGNALILLIMFCLSFKSNLFGFLNIKGFILLGEASYSIYIMHPIVIYSILKIFDFFGLLTIYSVPILLFSYFATYITSLFTFNLIEKKFIHYGKNLLVENKYCSR